MKRMQTGVKQGMPEKREEETNAPSTKGFVDPNPLSLGESARSSPSPLGHRRNLLCQPPRRQATTPLKYPSRARGRRDYALLIRTGMRVRAGWRGGVRGRSTGMRCSGWSRDGMRPLRPMWLLQGQRYIGHGPDTHTHIRTLFFCLLFLLSNITHHSNA